VYLPAEDLRRFGCEDLPNGDPEKLSELIVFEAARAADWFDRGLLLTDRLDRRSASCVQAMTGIYRRILDRIIEDPIQVTRGRISLSPIEKTWVAASSLVGSAAAAATSTATGGRRR
jgi:phytoene synthase